MKNYLITLTAAATLLAGCYDDKGQYDYTDVAEVTVSGIEKNYTASAYQDVLRIAPEIVSTHPTDPLAYLWTMDKPTESGKEAAADTIGTEAVLEYPVNKAPGVYTIALRVTNLSTGLEVYHTTRLTIVTQFSLGFYLLKDMDTYTELDFHLPDGSIIDVSSNLIESISGEKMPGKPVGFGLNFDYGYFADNAYKSATTLNISSENDMRILSTEDLHAIYTHASMFFGDEPTDEHPLYLACNGFACIYYFSDKGCYYNYQRPSWNMLSTGQFGYPVRVDGLLGSYTPSRHIIYSNLTYVFFDELNGRFLFGDYNGAVHSFGNTGQNGEVMPYLPNSIPHKLLYFGRGYAGQQHRGYALFEDAIDPSKHYLYQLNIHGELYNPVLDVRTLDPAHKLPHATLFATNELEVTGIYFVHDNQLYLYNVTSDTEKPLAPQGIGAGETITYIGHRYWSFAGDAPNNFNYLCVATHSGGKYKVYLYNMLGGEPHGAPVHVFEGTGKVVKVQFTSPMMRIYEEFGVEDYPMSF